MSYLSRIAESYASFSLSAEEARYYARHLLLPGVGTDGQLKLKAARVLVVGAGGLGCPALQALAGSGVGTITVIDGDEVAHSNLARQWLHRYADVGQNKADSAREKLLELNPFIELTAVAEMLSADNIDELIATHDVVVDATDNMDVRYLIDGVSARYNRPWVHAALYRDNAQLCVFWESCGARFTALYPERSTAPSCAGAGMLGAAASAVANLQALEVVKLIAGSSAPQVGTVVSLNSARLQMQSFRLPGVLAPELIVSDTSVPAHHVWTVDELRQRQSIGAPVRLIDLRSSTQFAAGSIEGSEHIAAEDILEDGLCARHPVLLFCEEGTISSLLADALRSRRGDSIFHLEGGFQGWSSAQ